MIILVFYVQQTGIDLLINCVRMEIRTEATQTLITVYTRTKRNALDTHALIFYLCVCMETLNSTFRIRCVDGNSEGWLVGPYSKMNTGLVKAA